MLTRGTKLGPYEIVSALGEGGMGQVYRARDTRLDRTVALKVLSAKLEATPELLARFEREARAIAALQHPNICVLHDLGREGATSFLVMEYLEGETLAARLRRGALPLAEIVAIVSQIAAALDRAHRAGIVHRDLKPANVMLTKSGAKLLDFGLAKTGITSSLVPTAIEAATQAGAVLGTIPYMAPEQLEGREADVRSDIYALGCVLYEMATGEPAFKGTRAVDPPALNRLIQACLARNPDERLQSAHDAGLLLAGVGDVGPAIATAQGRRWLWPAVTAAAVVVAAATAWSLRPAATGARTVTEITPPPGWHFNFDGNNPGPPVISPDGRNVVFSAVNDNGRTALWLRPLDAAQARELPGTRDAIFPFWSPDSASIGYFARSSMPSATGYNGLTILSINGGLPRAIAAAENARGGTWSADGTIVYSPFVTGGMVQTGAQGGPARPVAAACDAKLYSSCRFPFFLPDGQHYLYFAVSHTDPANDAIFEASLDGRMNRALTRSHSAATFAAGKLLYLANNALMAQGLEVASGSLRGSPQPVAQGFADETVTWRAAQSASTTGTLIYASGSHGVGQLAWVDRTGKVVAPLPLLQGDALSASVAPDGKRLAVNLDQGESDIWTEPVAGGALSRLTFGPVFNVFPTWSPDGTRIAYATSAPGANLVALRPAAGGAEQRVLSLSPAERLVPVAFTPDGRGILCAGAKQIAFLDLASHALRTVTTLHNDLLSQVALSPDGRWISDLAGLQGQPPNLFVVPADGGPGVRWQVTSTGALNHFWVRGGRELDVIDLEGRLLAIPVTIVGGTPNFGTPQLVAASFPPVLAATADGQRFLAKFFPSDNQRLMVDSNWTH